MANGMVYLSEPPNDEGVYPEALEVTLEASPDSDGSEVHWSGVDFQRDALAGITMSNDRFVEVEILPPVRSSVRRLQDDHGDSFDTATTISRGSTTGTIGMPTDLDFFRFFAEEGAAFIAGLLPETNLDTVLSLYDMNGTVLQENSNVEGRGRGSTIVWRARFGGDYFLEVRSSGQESQTGSYVVNLSLFKDDYGDVPAAAHDITSGSISGIIEPVFDVDVFRFVAEANTSFIVEVNTDSQLNTVLALMDDEGNLLAENHNAEGLNGGSRIMWSTPPNASHYFLAVGSPDPEFGTGSYVLSLTFIEDQHGDTKRTATSISPGNHFGTIDPPSDLDYFRFSAQEGDTYAINVLLGDHPNTVLALYHVRDLKLVENDDGEGLNGGSRIIWTAPAAGDYFLEVRSFDQQNDGGTYTLSLGLVPGREPSISGFYVGDIISFGSRNFGGFELKLEEQRGDVFGYINYEAGYGSGELESGSYAEGFLKFGVRFSVEQLHLACDYFADAFPEEGMLQGNYECFLLDGEFWDNGQWFAERQ